MNKRAETLRADRLAGIAITLASLYALGMLNLWLPTFRFTLPFANALTFAALQLVPIILLLFALLTASWWSRALWSLVLIPVASFAGLLGSCAALDSVSIFASGVDASFERIETIPLSPSTGYLAVYRTNGGATTSFGIEVRQECELLPGLLHVRRVFDAYPAYEVQTQLLAPDHIRFSTPAYGDRRSNEIVEEVQLRSLLCPAAG